MERVVVIRYCSFVCILILLFGAKPILATTQENEMDRYESDIYTSIWGTKYLHYAYLGKDWYKGDRVEIDFGIELVSLGQNPIGTPVYSLILIDQEIDPFTALHPYHFCRNSGRSDIGLMNSGDLYKCGFAIQLPNSDDIPILVKVQFTQNTGDETHTSIGGENCTHYSEWVYLTDLHLAAHENTQKQSPDFLVPLSIVLGTSIIAVLATIKYIRPPRKTITSSTISTGSTIKISQTSTSYTHQTQGSIEKQTEMIKLKREVQFDIEKMVLDRRCCKLNGKTGDMYCNICGRIIPEEWTIL